MAGAGHRSVHSTNRREGKVPNIAAVVISLVDRTDRREAMMRDLHAFPIAWKFIDAATGNSPSDLPVDLARQMKRFGRKLTNGELGCFKSHVLAYQQFDRHPELDWLIVIEDDVVVDAQFPFRELVDECERRDVHYIRLFAKVAKPVRVIAKWADRQLVRYLSDPYGTQIYLISRRGAANFISSVNSIDMPIDDELGRYWLNGLPPYAVFPFPAFERYSSSSIEGERRQAGGHRKIMSHQVQRIIGLIAKKRENRRLARQERR